MICLKKGREISSVRAF